MNKFKCWWADHGSTVLTGLSLIGFVSTIIFTAKEAPKAEEARKKAEKEKGDRLTVVETVKAVAPHYVKTAVSGISTAALMLGSEALGQKRIRTLEATCASLIAANAKFERVIDYPREDDDEEVSPWDGPQIFYLSFCEYPEFFECTEDTYLNAVLTINRFFAEHGWVNPYNFPKLLGFDKASFGCDDDIYYDCYREELFKDVVWIDFTRHREVLDDGLIVNRIDVVFRKNPAKKT